MKIHDESHTDHVTPAHLSYLRARFAERAAFFIETIELPDDLPELECGLYGPACGDLPLEDNEVFFARRSGRTHESRLVSRPMRKTRTCTVVAGRHGDDPCVLFTAYGGPAAPRETSDPTLPDGEVQESRRFWGEHALALSAREELTILQRLARQLVSEIDGLEGAEIPYGNAVRLAAITDRVRVAIGEISVIETA